MVYQHLGRYEDAALLFRQALATYRAQFGDDHPKVTQGCSNLGMVYQIEGRYEDAALLLEEALAGDRARFGDDHPTVTFRCTNLGWFTRP